MRGKSHRLLGQYLIQNYMPHVTSAQARAFLLGCVEPDRNPTTYLKGSRRALPLRGHHYPNAQRYMFRLARRLERRTSFQLLDYYALGKLMHYTADAFTYVHNETCAQGLLGHREYEVILQEYFLEYLNNRQESPVPPFGSVEEMIRFFHRYYLQLPPDIHRDSEFAFTACCCIAARLFAPAKQPNIGNFYPCPVFP